MLAEVIANITNIAAAIYKEEGKEPKWSKASDYMPIWDPDKARRLSEEDNKKQSLEMMKQTLLGIARLQNKKVDRKEAAKMRKPTVKRMK